MHIPGKHALTHSSYPPHLNAPCAPWSCFHCIVVCQWNPPALGTFSWRTTYESAPNDCPVALNSWTFSGPAVTLYDQHTGGYVIQHCFHSMETFYLVSFGRTQTFLNLREFYGSSVLVWESSFPPHKSSLALWHTWHWFLRSSKWFVWQGRTDVSTVSCNNTMRIL